MKLSFLKELKKITVFSRQEEVLNGTPLLIVANKQDMNQSLSVEEINNLFELNRLDEKRKWVIIGSSNRANPSIVDVRMQYFLRIEEAAN